MKLNNLTLRFVENVYLTTQVYKNIYILCITNSQQGKQDGNQTQTLHRLKTLTLWRSTQTHRHAPRPSSGSSSIDAATLHHIHKRHLPPEYARKVVYIEVCFTVTRNVLRICRLMQNFQFAFEIVTFFSLNVEYDYRKKQTQTFRIFFICVHRFKAFAAQFTRNKRSKGSAYDTEKKTCNTEMCCLDVCDTQVLSVLTNK